MECQASDSKKLFKVFDAKCTRKKKDLLDDSTSIHTDDSMSGCQPTVLRVSSAKASLQDVPTAQTVAVITNKTKRDRDSSPASRSPGHEHRSTRSPRRHRRTAKEGVSLALKAGMVSTPRSTSPQQEVDGAIESIPQDQDSFIYAFLEAAIKRDKKRHRDRHSRRHDGRASREASPTHEHHRHHHRRRREDVVSRDRERPKKEKSPTLPAVDQTVLFETFAKLCATMKERNPTCANKIPRTLSHKSLQCEVDLTRDYNIDHQPVTLHHEYSRDHITKTQSQENFRGRVYSRERIPMNSRPEDKCPCCYKDERCATNMSRSRTRDVYDERFIDPSRDVATRNQLGNCYRRASVNRDYDKDKHYDDKRRYDEQKTSRSYEVRREGYPDDEKCRRITRSENKYKPYDESNKYYDQKNIDTRERFLRKDRRFKQNEDRFDHNSIASREEYRERYSERERDSGLSVADGGASTVSVKSNCLKVVKQEIAEQREAMDKMMKLWKELMRCFKEISTQGQNKAAPHDSATVQESVEQLRLWRECMQRYETVARDVGDTDARLMEEISKQRSEMAEMASMWQECLQRYREMSTDFNNLKQQVTSTKQFVVPESPTRLPAAPVGCPEGEGGVTPAHYRLPPNYPQIPLMPPYASGGSPLRSRASVPPAWWWCGEGPRRSPRRRSSPDSRGSRDRDHRQRHKDRDRDDSRYKEKSKPNAARSEHRRRRR